MVDGAREEGLQTVSGEGHVDVDVEQDDGEDGEAAEEIDAIETGRGWTELLGGGDDFDRTMRLRARWLPGSGFGFLEEFPRSGTQGSGRNCEGLAELMQERLVAYVLDTEVLCPDSRRGRDEHDKAEQGDEELMVAFCQFAGGVWELFAVSTATVWILPTAGCGCGARGRVGLGCVCRRARAVRYEATALFSDICMRWVEDPGCGSASTFRATTFGREPEAW